MSTCYTDTELQAIADGASPAPQKAHLEACAPCRQRLDARREAMAAFGVMLDRTNVPPGFKSGVMTAVSRADKASGATTIRNDARPRRWAWQLGLAGATVLFAALVIYALLPRLGAPTELSAAEVIGRSVHALGEMKGVERLEYQLRIEGVHSPLLAESGDERLTIRHTIDHDSGRFLVGKYAADGTLVAGIAENPAGGVRTMVIRMNGRRYVARLALPQAPRLSMPQLGRTLLRTWLGILQASGSRALTLSRSPEGARYVVQMPGLESDPASAWDVQDARLVIDAADYHIVEADTRGHLLGSPYHVSFMLRSRQVGLRVDDGDFEFVPEPGDLVLEGEATDNPFWDVGSAALRRLAAQAPESAGSR
jgi:hypothetical protein